MEKNTFDQTLTQLSSTLTPLLQNNHMPPGLYIISTPIGNRGDITLRALYVLSQLTILYCEDTRHTGQLLKRYGLHVPLDSYHEYTTTAKQEKILNQIRDGAHVGLVSDAGMPLISDPGYKLVEACMKAGQYITVLPGASALLTGLVRSGLPTDAFLFLGFLPTKEKQAIEKLLPYKHCQTTLILYETAKRLPETLKILYDILGNRRITLLRELTKQHEEVVPFSLADAPTLLNEKLLTLKGEMVLVIDRDQDASYKNALSADMDAAIHATLQFLSVKETAALLSQLYGKSKKEIYQRALLLKDH